MKKALFVGIDIGGTKISAALVQANGKIIAREKIPTPTNASPRKILNCLIELVTDLLDSQDSSPRKLRGIGIGVPGIVDTRRNRIFRTPNVRLTRFDLVGKLRKSFPTKIILGNDVNLGLLGEQWLGVGKKANNIVGIFPGTGIGGAIIIDNQLYTGFQGVAGEIGHMIVDLKGPICSCGNHGCLEAFASRWAIERDIRQAIKQKKKSIIRKLMPGKLTAVKSKVLRKALKMKDPVVSQVMKNATKALGQACISVRHMMNPEMIILGGGLIEACGDFILPVVNKIVRTDQFFAHLGKCPVVASRLKDDAVMIGGVALVKDQLEQRNKSRQRHSH
jgi:glucokinase